MNDDLEQRLRDAFRTASLPSAPESLHVALDRVTESPAARRGAGRWEVLRVLAVAAAIVVLGVGAIVAGQSGPPPDPVSPPTDAASPSPSAWTNLTRFEYRVLADRPVTDADLDAVVESLQRRLSEAGVNGVGVGSRSPGRIVVDAPDSALDPERLSRLVGGRGEFVVVALGDAALSSGQSIDPTAYPAVFDSSDISAADATAEEGSGASLELRLGPVGAEALRSATEGAVGQSLGVVLDGILFAVPMIHAPIRDGVITIAFGSQDGVTSEDVADLVGILRAGPLPFALEPVPPGPGEPSSWPPARP